MKEVEGEAKEVDEEEKLREVSKVLAGREGVGSGRCADTERVEGEDEGMRGER